MKTYLTLLVLSFLIVGCSQKTSNDYFNNAKKDLAAKKYTEAVKNFETVVKDFPSSAEAPEALMQIALIYQRRDIPNLSAEESFKRSSAYYKQVFEKYPQSSNAPRSLFMSAFILANELQNYDEAKKTYELFIEKFPDNELATSAKEEIKNMGLPPEKIIAKNNNKNT